MVHHGIRLLRIPDPPTSLTMERTNDDTLAVTLVAPLNNGGSAITGYKLYDSGRVTNVAIGNGGNANSDSSGAMQMFRGSPEEVRVLISSSELAVQSGQTKRGLALLQSVRSDSPAYSKAQETMANVYLTKLHDKRCFCYKWILVPCAKQQWYGAGTACTMDYNWMQHNIIVTFKFAFKKTCV